MKKILIWAGMFFLLIPALSYSYDSRDQYSQYSTNSVNSPYNQYQYSGNINSPYNSQYNQYTPNSLDNPYNKYQQNSAAKLDDPFLKKTKEFNAEMAAKAAKKRQAQQVRGREEDAMAANFLKPKAAYPVLFYMLLFLFSIISAGLTIYVVAGIFKKSH